MPYNAIIELRLNELVESQFNTAQFESAEEMSSFVTAFKGLLDSPNEDLPPNNVYDQVKEIKTFLLDEGFYQHIIEEDNRDLDSKVISLEDFPNTKLPLFTFSKVHETFEQKITEMKNEYSHIITILILDNLDKFTKLLNDGKAEKYIQDKHEKILKYKPFSPKSLSPPSVAIASDSPPPVFLRNTSSEYLDVLARTNFFKRKQALMKLFEAALSEPAEASNSDSLNAASANVSLRK